VSRSSLWDVLQIEATDDPNAIRRAYARRLKVTHPEDDPKGFQALREAYDQALWYAEHRRREAIYGAMEAAQSDDEEDEVDPTLDEATFRSSGIDRPSPLVVPRPEPAPIRSPAPAPAEPPAGYASLEEELLARELERDGQALREGAEELERLLQASPFDERAAVRRLTSLLEMPALQNIGLSAGFEAWVENTLLSNLPNADVLIPLAVARFHWRRNAEGLRRQVGDGAVARDEDLIKFRDLQRKGGRYSDAIKALIAKPTRLRVLRWLTTPGLANEVANVLKAIREERPGLMQNLDAEAVAWWDAAPDRPKAGVGTFLLSVTPFIGLWTWLVAQSAEPVPPPTLWLLLLAALACSAGIAAGSFYGVIRPRARWRQEAKQTAPSWIRWGWAPFALVPLLAAALLTSLGVQGLWAMVPVALLSLTAIVWARITGEPDASPVPAKAMGLAHNATAQPTGRLILRNLYLAVFWAFLPAAIPLAQWLPLTIGLVACLFAFTDGLGGLKAKLAAIPPARRQRFYAPAALTIVAAMVLVAAFGSGETAGPWLAMLVGVLAIAEPLADTPLTEEAMRQRAGIMIPLLGILWMFLPMLTLWQDGALRVNGVWLLCGWLIALWYGLRRDRKLALPDRPRIRFGNIP